MTDRILKNHLNTHRQNFNAGSLQINCQHCQRDQTHYFPNYLNINNPEITNTEMWVRRMSNTIDSNQSSRLQNFFQTYLPNSLFNSFLARRNARQMVSVEFHVLVRTEEVMEKMRNTKPGTKLYIHDWRGGTKYYRIISVTEYHNSELDEPIIL